MNGPYRNKSLRWFIKRWLTLHKYKSFARLIWCKGFEFLEDFLRKHHDRNEIEDRLHAYIRYAPYIRLTEDIKILTFQDAIGRCFE